MPNPRSSSLPYSDRPLLERLDGATHVVIACRCFRQQIWLTSDLVARCPGAVTNGHFADKLRCKKCGLRGWATISAAGRN